MEIHPEITVEDQGIKISPDSFCPHPVFSKFSCYRGPATPGYTHNFMGVKTKDAFTADFLSQSTPQKKPEFIQTAYPPVDEEYIEWVDLLESVMEASGQFTMIELGAGYGKWLVDAALALRAFHPKMPFHLTGVEAEPTHFKWMGEHFKNNSVPEENYKLHFAAVAAQDGTVDFYIGEPGRWYGQAIAAGSAGSPGTWLAGVKKFIREKIAGIPIRWADPTTGIQYGFTAKVRKVKAISLNTLLKDLERVDLIDLDVQGEEFKVLRAAREALMQKVKRIHIGTHSPEIEADLRQLFTSMNWNCLWDYPMGKQAKTPHGVISFRDGIQTWKNPMAYEDTLSKSGA